MRCQNGMNKDAKIFVAGSRGMVGSAIVRKLEAKKFHNILTRTREELDLLDERAVADFYANERPEFVFLAAARVGGINANNTRPVEFLLENLRIQNNLIEYAYKSGVRKLLFLGSSCIYPKFATQPISEDQLLTGALEPTNEAYAIAKIAGIKLCHAYKKQYGLQSVSVMPTNLYGPNDNFDLETSHVLPALIRKFHEAREAEQSNVTLWGTGAPLREFMHVDDLADACLFLMQQDVDFELINAGSGEEISIRDLASLLANIIGFNGDIEFDNSMPDGTPRKLMDSSRMRNLGWRPSIDLRSGVAMTYSWAKKHRFDPSP